MAKHKENPLFRKSAQNHISSADDLSVFLKVTNPRAWIPVIAFLALILGLVIWSMMAVVPVTTTATALTDGGTTATCWVDAETAQSLSEPEAYVSIAGKEATSVDIGARPMSPKEIRDALGGEYQADELKLTDWNYQVNLEFADALYTSADGVKPGETGLILTPAEIVIAIKHPIGIVFGR